MHGHRFEIYALVSEIHENCRFGNWHKNILELEEIINSQEACFSFLNILIPFFPREQIILNPKKNRN